MKIYSQLHKAPIRVSRIYRRRLKIALKRDMIILKVALEQEKKETQEMLSIYHRYTKHQATKAEIREANKQFADILKGLSLSIFVILPFAPVTIPILIKVAKRVGVDLLPSAFNHDVKKIENKKKE